MTSQTVTSVELTDFRSVLLSCTSKNCGTVVFIALDSLQTAPQYCPTCKNAYGDYVQNRLNELLALCRSFAKEPLGVRILLKAE